jgi:xanthine phosphoribosyltransferase
VNKIYFPWGDIMLMAKRLHGKLQDTGVSYDHIAGVTRGGLVPAGLLAQSLDINQVDVLGARSYQGTVKRGSPSLLRAESVIIDRLRSKGPTLLIVDDIVDTGDTFKMIREVLPDATYVALCTKLDNPGIVDYYGFPMPQSDWIVFPWEAETWSSSLQS